MTDTTPQASGTFIVTPEQAQQRVDILITRYAQSTRAIVSEAAHAGNILINGTVAKGSTLVMADDTVTFTLQLRPTFEILPQAIALDIVHEDDTVLVVNKPLGMVTHPAHGSPDGTLVNALLHHVPTLPGERIRAGLIHRLDRDTSGLLLIAKTPSALSSLGRAMQKRYIQREYLGIVMGQPDDEAGTLDGPIARDPQNRLRYAVRSEGKYAVTHFRVQERLKGTTELTFKLETGRTHQIRVHMAAYGHPILNDPLYGRRDRRLTLPGQALHAWRLHFRHPITRAEMHFEIAPPEPYSAAKALFR